MSETFPPFMGHRIVQLAPGVAGYTRDDPDGSLIIPMVIGDPPNAGHVARYIDTLPQYRRVVFEACLSEKLAKMLMRRGFVYSDRATYDPDTEEWVDGFCRDALPGVP